MRSKFFISVFSLFIVTTKLLADRNSVVPDSVVKPFTPPDQGPLGINNITGVALYGMAILFAVLIIALWRRNITKGKA